ncbi:hypothetical protein BBP40_010004 [Aspergillus hancockii]|nr:hypothetical protein BBP40_010004 [Aspergillus hancockii]
MDGSITAAQRVLFTPELLETILLDLDLRTLLTSAQRTCRAWINLIRDSIALQRALYFTLASESRSPEKVLNPLLVDAFPAFFRMPENEAAYRYQSNGLLSDTRMFKHPETQPSFLRKEASWRRMLVQQPPVYKIARWHCSVGQLGVYTYREIPGRAKQTQHGLRMETLFEEVLFDPDPGLSFFDSPRITWGKHSDRDVPGMQHLETLGNFKVDADILIDSSATVTCLLDEGPPTLDQQLMSKVWDGYALLGLQPKCRVENGWLGPVRTFPFDLDLDGDDDL